MKEFERASELPLLRLSGHKEAGGKVALDGARLELHGPEILGVVGDNGAGKSTLLKVLAGVEDSGKGERPW